MTGLSISLSWSASADPYLSWTIACIVESCSLPGPTCLTETRCTWLMAPSSAAAVSVVIGATTGRPRSLRFPDAAELGRPLLGEPHRDLCPRVHAKLVRQVVHVRFHRANRKK